MWLAWEADLRKDLMAENVRRIHAAPDEVWRVLSDGWLYPVWVVGAARMREVDEPWPAVGSRLHHSVGLWPLLIDDHTEVLESTTARSLTMRARGWPVGEARVSVALRAVGTGTEVTIVEDAVSGPGVLAPPPLRGLTLSWRNRETLRRLAYIAEGR